MLSKHRVKRILKKCAQTGDVVRKGYCARARGAAAEQDHEIVRMFEKHPGASSAAVVRDLKRKRIDVGARPVRRRLAEARMEQSWPQFKPLLTTAHTEKRPKWARREEVRDMESGPLLSDETTCIWRSAEESSGPCVGTRGLRKDGVAIIGSTPNGVHPLGSFHLCRCLEAASCARPPTS